MRSLKDIQTDTNDISKIFKEIRGMNSSTQETLKKSNSEQLKGEHKGMITYTWGFKNNG